MNFLGQYTQLTIRLSCFFFLLQIWSALNWILQIVFDKHFFFQFRLINILKFTRIIQLKAKSMQNQNKWLS